MSNTKALEEQVTRHTEYCGLKPDTIPGHGICDCGADQAAAQLEELKAELATWIAKDEIDYEYASTVIKDNDQLRKDLDEAMDIIEHWIGLIYNEEVRKEIEKWLAAHPRVE